MAPKDRQKLKKAPAKTPSYAAQVLKQYRRAHHLSQEQFAYDLGMEPRTLRAYENGERALDSVKDLRRIADLLGMAPEQLGITTPLAIPRAPEEIEEAVEHVWTLVEASRIQEATTIILRLITSLESQLTSEDATLLRSLAHAYHAAGYAMAVGTRSYEAYKAIPYYREVETLGRLVGDPTLINIGLTYQGDMHQRMGEVDQAITFLEAARETRGADAAALGNGIQLLGRAYLRRGDLDSFERAMAASEELTVHFDPATSSTKGHYSLGTVYEEYGRSYADLGYLPKALAYLDKAQQALPTTEFWNLLIVTAKAIALVKGGEIRAGIDLAVEAAKQCRETGNVRFLDRIFIIEQYLDQLTRDIMVLSRPLREAIDGGWVTDY